MQRLCCHNSHFRFVHDKLYGIVKKISGCNNQQWNWTLSFAIPWFYIHWVTQRQRFFFFFFFLLVVQVFVFFFFSIFQFSISVNCNLLIATPDLLRHLSIKHSSHSLIIKEALAEVFSCQFCKNFKHTFSAEHRLLLFNIC